MDRPITRYEFETRTIVIETRFDKFEEKIEKKFDELSKDFTDFKITWWKYVATMGISFIAGGGSITAILKALGKL